MNDSERIKRVFAQNLLSYMNKHNLNQTDISDITGVSQQSVSNWLNAKLLPRMGVIETLSNYFKILKSDLIEDKTTDEQIYQQLDMSFIKVPLYDSISCGSGGFVDDNIIDYVSVPDSSLNRGKEYFAQKAKGDSMINAGILEDTVCIFEKTNVIDDGKIGCFCIDEGIATCKKFKKGPSFIQLLPMNNNYDPIVIDLHDANFRVLGVLKTSIKNWE